MRKEFMNRDSDPRSFHSFLMALKGRTVTIYRGGPNSKTGKLLDVKSDYVALLAQNQNKGQKNEAQNQQQGQNNEDPKVVYYQTEHVKSIIEDTKSNSMNLAGDEENQTEYLTANNFAGLFEQLMGENIEVHMGGPEVLHGDLMDLSKDHAVLFTPDDGMVYVNLHHVKSLCLHHKPGTGTGSKKTTHHHKWVKASCFHDVFSQFSHQWVSFNRKGPEAMEGVLVENAGGHYTMVNNQEVMRIHPFHIRSISCGPKGFMKQNNQNNANNQNNDENQVEGAQTEAAEQQEENQNTVSTTGSKRTSRQSNYEKVVKTIDYVWKG